MAADSEMQPLHGGFTTKTPNIKSVLRTPRWRRSTLRRPRLSLFSGRLRNGSGGTDVHTKAGLPKINETDRLEIRAVAQSILEDVIEMDGQINRWRRQVANKLSEVSKLEETAKNEQEMVHKILQTHLTNDTKLVRFLEGQPGVHINKQDHNAHVQEAIRFFIENVPQNQQPDLILKDRIMQLRSLGETNYANDTEILNRLRHLYKKYTKP